MSSLRPSWSQALAKDRLARSHGKSGLAASMQMSGVSNPSSSIRIAHALAMSGPQPFLQ
jgi:hypothetical protein